MRFGKFKIALLLLCCLVLGFEIWRLRVSSGTGQQATPVFQRHKPDFVLLPETEVAAYAEFQAEPKPRMESWEPTVADINDLNSNLSQISTLSGKEQDANRHIENPDQYFRQYLAVVVNGKKTIFVNALCRIDAAGSSDWRKHLIATVDGGKCFWKAYYDPTTRTFSNLIVNGIS